jgi:hypothetical protein
MSSIKIAAAVVLQRVYRDHLEYRAAKELAGIEKHFATFARLPTTRLDEAAANTWLQLPTAEPSTPFARTPSLRVYGGPEPTTTAAKASVLALVDKQDTADAMAEALKSGE